MSGHGEHAQAWSWWGRDPAVGEDLVFAAAAPHRADLRSLCQRAGIAAPDSARQLRPGQSGFTAALRHPDTLVWMPLDHFAARSHIWFDEEQLAVARRATTASRPTVTPPTHSLGRTGVTGELENHRRSHRPGQ